MTEYHPVNGTVQHDGYGLNEHTEHALHSLEDSVASLMSQDLHIADEQTTAVNLYQKAAKMFINKKFKESYAQCDKLKDVVLALYSQGKLGESIVVNTWCLFFNVVDILTKDSSVSMPELHKTLLSDIWFDSLNAMDVLPNPKLVYLLTLIKLHASETDLVALRQQVDMYLLQASGEYHQGDKDFDSFMELVELYHVHLLSRMGESEESEFLIQSNPFITDKTGMIAKLKQVKQDLEDEKRRGIEAQRRKKELLAAKKKEKQISHAQVQEDMFKEVGRAKETSMAEKKKIRKSRGDVTHTSEFDIVMDIIKKRLSFLAQRNSIVMVFALLGFIGLIKTQSLFMNANVRRWMRVVWDKFGATIQMALKVTYM